LNKIKSTISKYILSNKNYIKYSAFSYAVIILNILFTILSVRMSLKYIGPSLYNVWLLGSSTINLISLVNFGFPTLNIFKLEEATRKHLGSGFIGKINTSIIFNIFCLFIFYIVVYCYARILVTDNTYVQNYKTILILLFPSLILNTVSVYFESILFYNYKQIYQKSVLEFMRVSFLHMLTIFGLYFWANIYMLAVIYFAVSVVCFIYILNRAKKFDLFKVEVNDIDFAYVRDNYKSAFSYWILNVSAVIISQFDILFISSAGLLPYVVVYSQSFRMQEVLLRFIRKITELKAPKIFALYSKRQFKQVIQIYNKLLLLNIVVSIVAFLFIYNFGKPITEWLLGYRIVLDQKLISIVGLLVISGSVHWVLWNFIGLTGRQTKVQYIVILEISLNLLLSYFLIRKIGLIGLPVASLISNSITISYSFYLYFLFYIESEKGENE
jgi:O-antigen/teichoic acid export membrane protein